MNSEDSGAIQSPLDIDEDILIEESGSEGEEYRPETADVESEGSDEDDGATLDDEDDGGKKVKPKKGKPAKIGRQDIRAARTNSTATKTPFPTIGDQDAGDHQ